MTNSNTASGLTFIEVKDRFGIVISMPGSEQPDIRRDRNPYPDWTLSPR